MVRITKGRIKMTFNFVRYEKRATEVTYNPKNRVLQFPISLLRHYGLNKQYAKAALWIDKEKRAIAIKLTNQDDPQTVRWQKGVHTDARLAIGKFLVHNRLLTNIRFRSPLEWCPESKLHYITYPEEMTIGEVKPLEYDGNNEGVFQHFDKHVEENSTTYE